MVNHLSLKSEASATLHAWGRFFAIIESAPDGRIGRTKGSFCAAIGCQQDEIVDRRHRMFVDDAYATSFTAFGKACDYLPPIAAGEFRLNHSETG